MDHVRISGIGPLSVILSQNKVVYNLRIDSKKLPKQGKAKSDGVINPQYYNFNEF